MVDIRLSSFRELNLNSLDTYDYLVKNVAMAFNLADNFLIPKKIIFHNPATIVYWCDGTKTVVKCGSEDKFDKETGLAMCFVKKLLGRYGRSYHSVLKKYISSAKRSSNER